MRPAALVRSALLGPAAERQGPLPARVARAISRQDEQSELLIGLVQAAVLVVFAALYAASPKAFPGSAPFQPVPIMLAAAFCFTALRLFLAWRRRLTPWFLRASVVIDIAGLMLTIWSFHLQYQSAPALYLKAPTLMYAFILIAVRALRFQVEYVVLAGVAAALGWLALLGYAVLAGATITHSFGRYAMSEDILIGAEIDKVITILAVTGILALVIARARGLLVAAVAEQQSTTELSRFFAPEVASQIRMAELQLAPGQGVQRDAAILTTDLRNFTGLAATLPPAATLGILNDYHAHVVPVIQAHGGSVDKYLGDGILASFGATRPSATPAADAFRAADAILAAFDAWAADRAAQGLAPLRLGLAIAAGPVLFGTTGDPTRLEYTVIGAPVNLACKLEKATKALGRRAVATAEAADLALAQGHLAGWQSLGSPKVEGVAEPVAVVASG